MKLNKNYFFFNVKNIHQAIETISICKTSKILPIFSIKFYLIDGFGPDWIIEFRNILLKKFNTKNWKNTICFTNRNCFNSLMNVINIKK